MLKKISLAIILIFFIGCKENKTESTDNTQIDSEIIDKPKQEENFKVKIKGVFNKDDQFTLFYIENESEKFNAQKVVVTKFDASNEIQEITLETPVDVYPMNIMLDFSSNKEQSSIKIYECILEYKSKSYTIKGSELKKYFRFNDGVKMQPDSVTFNFPIFKLNGKEECNPYIIGNKKLTEVFDFEL